MSSQAVTGTSDSGPVSENVAENAADNESITRVIARLATIGTALHAVPAERLPEVLDALDRLERAVAPRRAGT